VHSKQNLSIQFNFPKTLRLQLESWLGEDVYMFLSFFPFILGFVRIEFGYARHLLD